jgi:CheY-like chemotaxis protein
VEDEWLVAQDAQDVLEANGHVILGIATDTFSALAIAAEQAPELALVDLYLHDGRTGPAIARQLTSRHGTQVLYMTGHAHELPGVPNVLGKPLHPSALHRALA